MRTLVLLVLLAATGATVAFLQTPTRLGQQTHRTQDETTQDLWDVLAASKRILDYYKAHMTDMNMDAVLGTRMAEGQYAVLLNAFDTGAMAPRDAEAIEVLRQLLADIRTFNNIAEDYIKGAYPDYSKALGRMMAPGFFEIPLMFLQLDNSTDQYKGFDNLRVLQGVEQLHEKESDACLTEVLTGVEKKDQHHIDEDQDDKRAHKRHHQHHYQNLDNDDDLVKKIAHHFLRQRRLNLGFDPSRCLLSGWCWSTMTGTGYSGYSLTHQLFYLITAMQTGCRDQIDEVIAHSGREPLEDIIRSLCTNVLKEAHALVEANYPEMRKDLFMEQGVFCGQLGYTNFFPRSWVRHVLSWQRDIGCYGDYHLYKAMQKPEDAYNKIKRKHKSAPGHRRDKRNEKSMPGDCMAHRSATAIGYLAVALRTLIFI